MKYLYNIIAIISLSILSVACTDDPLFEKPSSAPDFNIEKFSEGYSIAFDVTLDELGGGMNTRSTLDDDKFYEWENHLNPEEFRILFFDQYDRFLFESKTRYFAEQQTNDGKKSYRVGVPVFQYVSDGYDDYGVNEGIPLNEEYNWERIVDIMKTEPFKIAILANRPKSVEVPSLDDWEKSNDPTFNKIAKMGTTFNGPFWGPENSVATENIPNENVKEIIDLHHSQFDPLYYYKSLNGGRNKGLTQGNGWYDFIMNYDNYTDPNNGETLKEKVAYMGAMSSWISLKRKRKMPNGRNDDGTAKYREIRYYRLPIDNPITKDHDYNGKTSSHQDAIDVEATYVSEPQYIPMYGIQLFDPIPTWSKGTTFNISEQTASQTGDFEYKNIFLLRSVVKLEVRIPWYDKNGKEIKVYNNWAQLWFNNYMARCEPMDISTPTDKIWDNDHNGKCEWLRIKEFGLLADNGSFKFKEKLGWFYGIWKYLGLSWNYKDNSMDKSKIKTPNDGDEVLENPRIFNPLTQRLQCTLITDCYQPIEGQYHRWIIYCGERNMNDPNYLDESNNPTVTFFRIPVNQGGSEFIYYLPITDYSKPDHPVKDILKETNGDMTAVDARPNFVKNFVDEMYSKSSDFFTYPLLRNHYYRLTVSYGDNDDINIQIMNSDKRDVFGIEFN